MEEDALTAILVAIGMVTVWLRSTVQDPDGDFPDRYWFAMLPMLLAAIILWFKADEIRNPKGGPRSDRAHPVD